MIKPFIALAYQSTYMGGHQCQPRLRLLLLEPIILTLYLLCIRTTPIELVSLWPYPLADYMCTARSPLTGLIIPVDVYVYMPRPALPALRTCLPDSPSVTHHRVNQSGCLNQLSSPIFLILPNLTKPVRFNPTSGIYFTPFPYVVLCGTSDSTVFLRF